MEKTDPIYQAYLQILQTEMVPATGCTEPIAIAFAAAKARDLLGARPEAVELSLSGGIIKNAHSASVPGTGGKGIQTAVAAGVCAGDAEKRLQVIADIPAGRQAEIAAYAAVLPVQVQSTGGEHLFEIVLTARVGGDTVRLHILDAHTNLVSIQKNGVELEPQTHGSRADAPAPAYESLELDAIIRFADGADLRDILPLTEHMRATNLRIAREGLAVGYGANIGKMIRQRAAGETSTRTRAMALAAAASDARMGGCGLPVVITAGSGNQGLAASLPVIAYAEATGAPDETLHRALALSVLLTVYQKNAIGKLSAFCGAVSAGAAAGAGIAYLHGGRYPEIAHTLVNALAILSGMVCDGAKPSCAAKIAMAVEAGIMGWEMYLQGQQFYRGEGLVSVNAEKTIANIGRLGRNGMEETDREILRIMTDKC